MTAKEALGPINLFFSNDEDSHVDELLEEEAEGNNEGEEPPLKEHSITSSLYTEALRTELPNVETLIVQAKRPNLHGSASAIPLSRSRQQINREEMEYEAEKEEEEEEEAEEEEEEEPEEDYKRGSASAAATPMVRSNYQQR
jgi:hypothetical protein